MTTTTFRAPWSLAQAKKRGNGVHFLGKVISGRFEVPTVFYGDLRNAVTAFEGHLLYAGKDQPFDLEDSFPHTNWQALAERCKAFATLSNRIEFLPYYVCYRAKFGLHKLTLIRVCAGVPLAYGEEPDTEAALEELLHCGPVLEGLK